MAPEKQIKEMINPKGTESQRCIWRNIFFIKSSIQFIKRVCISTYCPQTPTILLQYSVLRLQFTDATDLCRFYRNTLCRYRTNRIYFINRRISFCCSYSHIGISILHIRSITKARDQIGRRQAGYISKFSGFSFIYR